MSEIRRESIEDALENDRCGLCGSVDHFREDCPAPAGDGPRTDTAERLAEAPECGSNIRIEDGEAYAFAVCLRPAGHDEPHGNGDLRWARLDQQYGRPIDALVADR